MTTLILAALAWLAFTILFCVAWARLHRVKPPSPIERLRKYEEGTR